MERIKSHAYNLLRKSEKYTKTDMVYLAKGGFWLVLYQVVSMFMLFSLSVVYANFLSPTTYGVFKYVIAMSGVIGAFSLTGINTFIVQRINNGFNIRLKEIFLQSLKWNFLTMAISLITSIYYYLNENITLSVGFLLISFLIPITSSSSIYESYLNGLKKFKTKSILSIISVTLISTTVALTIFYTEEPLIIIGVYLFINALVSFLSLIYVSKKIAINTCDGKEIESLGFAKHLSLIRLLGVISSKIDSVLVFTLIGAAELAIYTFAVALPNQILGLLKTAYTLALPNFSKNQSLKGSLVANKMIKLLFFSIPIYVIYYLAVPHVFNIFFPQYEESIFLSQILGLLIIFSGGGLQEAFLDSKEEVKNKYLLNITSDTVNITLLVTLTMLFGLSGAVAARVLGRVFFYFLSLFVIRRIE